MIHRQTRSLDYGQNIPAFISWPLFCRQLSPPGWNFTLQRNLSSTTALEYTILFGVSTTSLALTLLLVSLKKEKRKTPMPKFPYPFKMFFSHCCHSTIHQEGGAEFGVRTWKFCFFHKWICHISWCIKHTPGIHLVSKKKQKKKTANVANPLRHYFFLSLYLLNEAMKFFASVGGNKDMNGWYIDWHGTCV